MNTNEGALGHLHFNHYEMILSEAPCPPNYEMSQTPTQPQQLVITYCIYYTYMLCLCC